MEGAAQPRAVSGDAAEGHRGAIHRQVLANRCCRYLSLRVLRHAAVRVGHQVRRRLRLAELLCAGGGGQSAHAVRRQPFHAPHGGALRGLRRAPRPRLRRRPAADGTALLHELRIARLRAEGQGLKRVVRLLLAEDDPMIGASLRRGLRQDGFAVDWVEDGRAAELALAERVHDAIVLDLGLPKRLGLDVLVTMRRRGDARPVLILTARDAVADRIAGLDAGADDYVVKPFDLDELAARLRALLRRGSGRARPVLAHAGLELNPATHEASLKGESLVLSPREFALLEALLTRPGAILSRAQLEE